MDHSSWLLLSRSAAEMRLVGVLWLFPAFISHPRFLVAGFVSCLCIALNHWLMAENGRLKLIPSGIEELSEVQAERLE